MDRKTFIQRALGLMLIAAPAYTLVNCSSSDDSSDGPDPDPDPNGNSIANCLDNGTVSSISANHGHTLSVSQADVEAGVERMYSIQGSSGHNHTVTITADDFMDLQGNNNITVNSTNDDGHTHSVTVRCA